jgi:beta-lactamase regulating signal transducer with metallopeptidase domain
MSTNDLLPFANHLWQSTLFAIAVWLIALTLRENRAAVRHRLWLVASVKFLIPFSVLTNIGSHFQWERSVARPPAVSMIVETISQPFLALGPSSVPPGTTVALQASRLPAVLIGLWICGISASLCWWFTRWLKVRRAVRLATPSNLDGSLRVMYGPARFEPGVFGIFRPVLLLPDGITQRLSPAQLQAVLAHELCHVRRRDNLVVAIHMVVEALFWFHPLVWFIKARLIEEQERACDEEVLRLGGDPQVYAESILRICEFCLTSPLICVSGISGSKLKKRIDDIMRNRVAIKLSLSRVLLLAVAAIAALAGPVMFGIARVKVGEAQSEPAVRSVANPARIGEQRPTTLRTAQLQGPQTAPATIPRAAQASIRESARTSSVLQEYRFGEIKVSGAKILHDDVIRSLLGLVSGDVFNELRLQWGVTNLRMRYASLGYVRFGAKPVLDFDEPRKVVNLTVYIDEDLQFNVGEIKVTGAKVLHPDFIRSSLGLVSGEVYDESRLRKGFYDLKKLYDSLGYINFLPDPVQDFDEQQKVVNLNVYIDEGRQFTVNRITFTGNTTTRDEVIRREIFVKAGDVFNSTLWYVSVSRLNQLGFFEDIKEEDSWIEPSPNEPKVDITLRLKEKTR